MNTIKYVRKLAKSDESQNLYIMAKDIATIKLLDNSNNFTYIQNIFLRYLNFYYTIYSDISIGDVDEIVLENEIYEDSYIMYKNKKDKEHFKNNVKPKNEQDVNSMKTSKWIFKSKNEKKL